MNINIDTKFITLIGTPLSQSFAARMQNAAYDAMGINIKYFYTEADCTHLEKIIGGIRYMPSLVGFAVTKPNKVKVMQFLDEFDSLCEKIGACNTVVKQPNGNLKGYNTDGLGFLRSLKEEAGIDPKGKRFFCFGAGGAGRAICSILAYNGAERIYIADLNKKDYRSLCEDINQKIATVAIPVSMNDYFTQIADSDVVMNVTGIGMGDTKGMSPMPIEYVLPWQLYFDASYNPNRTQFLMNAEKKGCKILNGLGMSLFQGAVQIELWTGQKAPVDVMRNELLDILKEKK